jgi:ABC-2 type transport system permease protein
VGQPLRNLSPFTHVPHVLTGDASFVPLAGLLAMTALLTTTGLLRFRQRDVG